MLWFLGVTFHSPSFLHLRSSLNYIECDLHPMAYVQSSMVGDESLHAARVVAPIRTVLTAKTRSRNFDRHFYCLTA